MRRVLGIFVGTIIATYAVPAGAVDLYPNFDGDWEPIKWGGFFVAPYFGYETLHLNGAGAALLDDPSGRSQGDR